MVMAAAMAAARAAARTPVSAATRIVQRRLGTSSTGRKDDADNVDIINQAITLAKSSDGKKVVNSILITLGITSFVHWTVSTLTAHAENETGEKVIQQDESNKAFQFGIEKEPLQLDTKL
ncbi:uncharacterized protein LOC124702355 [Lolium rigidum]|uniref:uncharacterized protein LOC124702355 n=1 Tax=Lolium rigidum TaxID=89674 RepID=UPI001F5CF258|nr:uncharacterized protein LOC124702355 [Lolium rigidum]